MWKKYVWNQAKTSKNDLQADNVYFWFALKAMSPYLTLFLLFTEPEAVTETGVISQDI